MVVLFLYKNRIFKKISVSICRKRDLRDNQLTVNSDALNLGEKKWRTQFNVFSVSISMLPNSSHFDLKMSWNLIRKFCMILHGYLRIVLLLMWFFFYFLSPINGRESTVFWANFRNWDFDAFLPFEALWIWKSNF